MCAAAKASGSSVSREFFENLGKMTVNLFLRECVSRKVDIAAVRPFGNVPRSYTQRGRKVYTTAVQYLQHQEKELFNRLNNPPPTSQNYSTWLIKLSGVAKELSNCMVDNYVQKFNSKHNLTKKKRKDGKMLKNEVTVNSMFNLINNTEDGGE